MNLDKERDAEGFLQRLRSMSDDEKRELAEAMMPKSASPRTPTKPRMPGPNKPCRCGSGKKYKKCCGSLAGEARVIVVDPTTGDVLRNIDGRVALFKEFEGAAAAAVRTGWHNKPNTELVTLTETRWRQMAQEIPCADVSLVGLDLSLFVTPTDSSEPETGSPGDTGPTSSGSSG
jgi:hypothetical protein